jgi:hypothetical protein
MTETGEDVERDYAERMSGQADARKNAWKQTLQDMRITGKERREEGWTVLEIGAGDTAPLSRDAGDTEKFGISYVIPGNKREEFLDVYDETAYDDVNVYQAMAGGNVFILTEVRDTDSRDAILLAGSYEARHADGCVRAALDEGKMYTHVRTLDGTFLGSFEHDDVGAFFPNPDRFLEY